MSARDREVLELLREEPELLAIADAVYEVERVPRRSFRRRRTVAAVAAAAAALFAFALISPWERGDGRGLVLERALAALDTRGPVLHVVSEASEGLRVELKTGKTTRRKTIQELWYDPSRRLLRTVLRRDGRVAFDRTGSVSRAELQAVVGLTGPFAGAADYYREALRSGKARVVGTGDWRDRPVYWLELDLPAPAGLRIGIDRRTYQPLIMKVLAADGGETRFEVGLLRLEYVSRAEAPFGKVIEDAWKFEGGGGGFGTVRPSLSVTEARTVLGVPAVWAGWRFADFPLVEIALEEVRMERSGRLNVEGEQLHIVYGGRLRGRGTPGAGIVQVRAKSPIWGSVHDLPPPPQGFADLTSSEIYTGPDVRVIGTRWTATLAAGRVWVRVEAPSRELAIAAARALRPIPPG